MTASLTSAYLQPVMHLYSSARGHWMKERENSPIDLIQCAEKDTPEAHYASRGGVKPTS